MDKLKVYLFPMFRGIFEWGFRVQRESGPNGDSAPGTFLRPCKQAFLGVKKDARAFCPMSTIPGVHEFICIIYDIAPNNVILATILLF